MSMQLKLFDTPWFSGGLDSTLAETSCDEWQTSTETSVGLEGSATKTPG